MTKKLRLTADAPKSRYQQQQETRKQREAFERVRRTEIQYASQLGKIARAVGDLVKGVQLKDASALHTIVRMLKEYAQVITPWAQSVAQRILADVVRRDERAWQQFTQALGEDLRREVLTAPVGHIVRDLMRDQVNLITSLPLKAAERVQELAMEAVTSGEREDDLLRMIMNTGQVTRSRANLIARTEIARASSVLTEARARQIGSEGYIWRTSRDKVVRPIHRRLEGQFIRWSEPPIAGERGERAHAGCIYNCRCYPEPVIPRRFD